MLVSLVNVIWSKAPVKCWSMIFEVQSVDYIPSKSSFKIDDYWSAILVEGINQVLIDDIRLEVSIVSQLHTIDE